MTLPLERTQNRRPVTWLTILGILLLPAVLGGILVLALQNPTEHLDRMTAAIVNDDEPITLDGQYTPLGRQLAAGLVAGSDDADSNLTWVISNDEDAQAGLSDGRYQAVITIPAEFSSAATSAGRAIADAAVTPQQAVIRVTTPSDGRIADDLITGQVAATAATTLGTMLGEATTENVLLAFTTLGTELGAAADGAEDLADGARQIVDGASALPGGAAALADGAGQLAGGAGQLAGGATDLAAGLDELSSNTRVIGSGIGELGAGLAAGADQIRQNGVIPPEMLDMASQAAGAAGELAATSNQVLSALTALADECGASGADAEFCDRFAEIITGSNGVAEGVGVVADIAEGASAMLDGVAQFAPEQIATQFDQIAAATTGMANGIDQIAGGIDQSAGGVRALRTGVSELGAGAGALSGGATELSRGAGQLVDGLGQLADGTGELAGGLQTAVDEIPRFSDERSNALASVIADPVSAEAGTGGMFGAAAIPLLSAVALWFGGLATFLVLRAFPAATLTSRRSAPVLALRAFAPAAVLGAAQGVLVALIVQLVARYDAGTWWAFAGVAILAGITFAAVNQALVAVLGGIGRWVSALIGVLAVATGIISTVPAWLAGLGAGLPTAPAVTALMDGRGVAALVVWGVLCLGLTVLAVALRRTTTPRALARMV